MRVRVLAVGKLKAGGTGFDEFAKEMCKRSRAFLPIELVHLKTLDSMRTKAIRPRVLLDERGEHWDTKRLADWLGDARDRGVRQVDFLVGESHGFEPRDREDADCVLALSKMTLPHRLAQLLVLEQLYRCGTILAGHPYHH